MTGNTRWQYSHVDHRFVHWGRPYLRKLRINWNDCIRQYLRCARCIRRETTRFIPNAHHHGPEHIRRNEPNMFQASTRKTNQLKQACISPYMQNRVHASCKCWLVISDATLPHCPHTNMNHPEDDHFLTLNICILVCFWRSTKTCPKSHIHQVVA